MLEIKYSKWRLWAQLLGFAAITYPALWVGHFYRNPRLFSPPTLLAISAVFLTAGLLILLHDALAFRAARDALTLGGIWRKRRIAWRDVSDVGFVVMAAHHNGKPAMSTATPYLRFTVAGEEIKLRYDLFALPQDEGPLLVERIEAVRRDAVPVTSARASSARRDPLEGVTAPEVAAGRPVFGRKPN